MTEEVICEHCNNTYVNLKALKRHLGLNKSNGNYNVSCPGLDPSLKKKMISDYPHLLKEYTGSEDPTKIRAGTHRKLDWKCSICEHEWKAKGDTRSGNGRGCPACSNQAIHIDGRNSMAQTHPELAKEYQGDATKIIAGTNKRLDWKCSICDYEWTAQGSERVRPTGNTGCPTCAESGFDASKPAYVYQIRFHTRNHGVFYKCGITNRDYIDRTKRIINSYKRQYDDAISINVIDYVHFEDGSVAWDFERKLKTSGLDLGAKFFSKKFEGFTETYAPSVIPYWNTLKFEMSNV